MERNPLTRIALGVVINAVALWVAARVVPGVSLTDNLAMVLMVALVFGVANTFIRPILALVTCPFYIITLGLFTFVMNAIMLMITGWFTNGALTVEGWWPGIVAGIVVSIVSFLTGQFLRAER